jgi:DNA (cytosine-5)-methyltransferase 1
LFSGVGGFELAWTQLGHEVAWMCEVDKKARLVLKERFPSITIYKDVRDIDPAEVAAVDVLTGGSPCQGFSIAGDRTGMQHSQSGLFEEYVRIMDGLADRGLQYAIWENVPGVLSIKNPDGERTFKHVIGALAGADEPAPLNPRARWNAGMVAGQNRTVAWRVLDSQYFGVAQRRRRVFACVAFGDSATNKAGRTLLAVPESVPGDSASGRTPRQETSGTVEEGVGSTSAFDEMNFSITAETHHVLRAGTKQSTGVVMSVDLHQVTSVANRQKLEEGPARTLHSGGNSGVVTEEGEPPKYGVRRLTPVECERLQGFPDGWTDVDGVSDTARYKAMGNAVTVNTVRWILSRLPEVT